MTRAKVLKLPSDLNEAIELALSAALNDFEDPKDRMAAVNAAIKWVAVKNKLGEEKWGSGLNDDEFSEAGR